jgi:hypothetical protein
VLLFFITLPLVLLCSFAAMEPHPVHRRAGWSKAKPWLKERWRKAERRRKIRIFMLMLVIVAAVGSVSIATLEVGLAKFKQ